MIPRDITEHLLFTAKKFPVVTLCGPRQSGKTTLLRHLFSDKPYINLESTEHRAFAKEDRQGFLAQFPEGALFDEIQQVPDLLSDIQVLVDERQQMGQFVISGSQQINLLASISQSLAGRTVINRLLPLALSEIPNTLIGQDANLWLWQGGYPGRIQQDIAPPLFFQGYVESYVQRDLRQLTHIIDLANFEKFLKLCAGRIGGIMNKDHLARDMSISPNTVESWLSILETSFVAFRLPAWYKQLGKRLVKRPKFYFYDTGLACYLLGIQSPSQLATHPLRGELFENLQVIEALKTFFNQGIKPELYFYRDSNQNEVDLIIEQGINVLPIEIKSGMTFHSHFVKGLAQFSSQKGIQCPWGQWLVLGGNENYQRKATTVIDWQSLGTQLSEKLFNTNSH